MLSIKNCFVAIAAAAATSAMAQNLADPLPSPGGPAGPVDKVLADIARNMKPSADLIDAQSETAINRDVSISRSTGQLLRPIGFIQVGDERAIFASEDGQRVAKLKEHSRLGVMRISKISEDGVEYTASGKLMYAPMAYLSSEPPKAPALSAQSAMQQAPAAQTGATQAGNLPPNTFSAATR